MQSDLLSHINGLFSGRCRRKSEAVFTADENGDSQPGCSMLSEKFRRKSETVIGNGSKNSKQDGGGKSGGISLVRVAKLDFKLNLKRLSFGDEPPALPARHFSVDSDDDLPPPIPERKCSLDVVVDEEFQGRFAFRPVSTVPLPEEFTDCKKTYPSKMPRRHALQRPPLEPPPPPPPMDSSTPSPTSPVTFHLTPPITVTSHDDANDDAFLPPPPPPPPSKHRNAHGLVPPSQGANNMRLTPTGSNSSSLYNDVIECKPEPPPPPTRPLPPPPQSSKKPLIKLSSFTSIPAPPVFHTDLKSPETSPKPPPKSPFHLQQQLPPYATVPRPKPFALSTSKSEPSFDDTIKSPSSPTPTSTPSSPPPPPLPARPALPTLTKPKLVNGVVSESATLRKSPPMTDPSVIKPPVLPPHAVTKHRELPQLPVKPSQHSPNASSPTKSLTTSIVTNGGSNHEPLTPDTTALPLPPPPFPELHPHLSLRSASPLPPPPPPSSSPPPLLPPPPPRATSPLPLPPPPETLLSPPPPLDSHPNKNRPLPSIPTSPTQTSSPLLRKADGWGGKEVFDPREEDGDLYDVMDSTNM